MSRSTITTLSVAGTEGGSEALPADAQVSAPVNTFPAASTRAPLHNRMLIRLLRSRLHRLVDGSVVALRVRGVVTGSLHELPVIYAVDSTGYVVYPGRPTPSGGGATCAVRPRCRSSTAAAGKGQSAYCCDRELLATRERCTPTSSAGRK